MEFSSNGSKIRANQFQKKREILCFLITLFKLESWLFFYIVAIKFLLAERSTKRIHYNFP
ncbi:hypothetical protein X293_01965 [Oenococcus oeni IOEB_C52]|nr:hypothetical protein X293_01965 [Oenococcus oeni IOEB_C52]